VLKTLLNSNQSTTDRIYTEYTTYRQFRHKYYSHIITDDDF